MKLRLLVSVALLAAVVAWARPERILPAIARADARWLLAAAGLWIAVQLMNVGKWWLLARAQGLVVGYRALLDVYFIGMFFNTFLPSGFGGDVLRAWELARRIPEGGGGSVASVLVDRFTSLYALCLLAGLAVGAAALGWAGRPAEVAAVATYTGPLGILVAVLVLGGAAVFAALLHAAWIRRLAAMRTLARRPRAAGFLDGLAGGLDALRGARRTLLAALGISAGFQALAVVLHYCLIRSLDLDVSLAYTACFFPVLSLLASLPVTVNGLAVREGGFVLFLGQVGVAAPQAVGVGLLSLALLLLSGGWGAVVYAGARRTGGVPALSPDAGP